MICVRLRLCRGFSGCEFWCLLFTVKLQYAGTWLPYNSSLQRVLGLGFRFICLENMVGVSGLSTGGTISKTSNERNRRQFVVVTFPRILFEKSGNVCIFLLWEVFKYVLLLYFTLEGPL